MPKDITNVSLSPKARRENPNFVLRKCDTIPDIFRAKIAYIIPHSCPLMGGLASTYVITTVLLGVAEYFPNSKCLRGSNDVQLGAGLACPSFNVGVPLSTLSAQTQHFLRRG